MEFNINEWLNLFIRWGHLIFGIMWIGNSIYFNWLDNSMRKPQEEKEGVLGEVWMFHGGGFYLVEKKTLSPDKIPNPLHWFKYESYFTWISGFFLISVVYYLNAKLTMIDPSKANLTSVTAPLLGIGVLAVGWLVYDVLWRFSKGKNNLLFVLLTALFLVGVSYFLTQVFTGRAAYIHVGALMGTIMTFNVFFHIIPLQKKTFAAAAKGEIPNPEWGKQAKQRSRHNNYFTFPVLFIMISNHFPSTYGHSLNWLVLVVFMLASATIKHFMNVQEGDNPSSLNVYLLSLLTVVFIAGLVFSGLYKLPEKHSSVVGTSKAKVSFQQVHSIIQQRCVPCHSKEATDKTIPVPKTSWMDTPQQIKELSERIKVRAVSTKTMPLANKTQMTDKEREVLKHWINSGSSLH